jgi:hypothetical protein
VQAQHQEDLAIGCGAVYLPDALARQRPNANREWIWQYVFPGEVKVKLKGHPFSLLPSEVKE